MSACAATPDATTTYTAAVTRATRAVSSAAASHRRRRRRRRHFVHPYSHLQLWRHPRMKNTIYYQLSISTVNTPSAPLGSWNASTDSNAVRNDPAISAA